MKEEYELQKKKVNLKFCIKGSPHLASAIGISNSDGKQHNQVKHHIHKGFRMSLPIQLLKQTNVGFKSSCIKAILLLVSPLTTC